MSFVTGHSEFAARMARLLGLDYEDVYELRIIVKVDEVISVEVFHRAYAHKDALADIVCLFEQGKFKPVACPQKPAPSMPNVN